MRKSAQDRKLAVLAVIKEKRSITSVAKEYKIARKTLYSWINRYQNASLRLKNECLKDRYIKGSNHPKSYAWQLKARVIREVTKDPKLSATLLAKKLRVGRHVVVNVLSQLNLSNLEDRKSYARLYSGPGRLDTIIKGQIVRDIIEKNLSVSEVSREKKVARKTLYSWISQYKEEGKVKERYTSGFDHPRSYSQEQEKSILDKVVVSPELSIHSLAKEVNLSSHGIFNVLKRYGLTYKDARVRYSEQSQTTKAAVQPTFIDRIRSVLENFIPTLAPAPPPSMLRKTLRASPPLTRLLKTFTISSFASFLVSTGFLYWIRILASSATASGVLGLIFASTALLMGSFFFLYSFKYYFTLAIVLSFSQQEASVGVSGNGKKRGLLSWILGLNGQVNGKSKIENGRNGPVGLEPNLEHVNLKRHPYFSIHIPFYNEKNVVERAIAASTNFDYGSTGSPADYEVILCDDSTDETTQIIRDYQKSHLLKGKGLKVTKNEKEGWELTEMETSPGVTLKHLHRTSRSGFKGGALRLALKVCDPRTEFISIFDADFVPYPDTLELFIKYFKVQNNMSEEYKKSNVAAVCGYQWHVLNKSENWITRGVRTEYAGSYVIERSGTEIYGGMKLIHGSVYAIRRDALEAVGWETSITEDFELTLKLYDAGYKVVYTPYIQAPAECVSTLKRLIRQRMRWAEGHSHNVRKMFTRLMFGRWEDVNSKFEYRNSKQYSSSNDSNSKHLNLGISNLFRASNLGFRASRKWIPSSLTAIEKLEFLYLTPYYLQAFFFLIGTFSWLLSETVFPARLPFWTSLWGWSLVLTNLFALPLMNAVGLFLEESEERDYLGLASFVALSYLLVPFQAYASVKGFLEKEEGTWFRTPKTGRITDVFTRGRFYRFISGILPGKAPAVAQASVNSNMSLVNRFTHYNLPFTSKYLALSTANSHFDDFKIRPRHIRWVGKLALVILLISSLIISKMAINVPLASATAGTQIKTVEFFLYQYNSATEIIAGNGIDNTAWGATCGSGDSDPSVTINIPESGITFKSVVVEYRSWQSAASGTTVSDYDIQFCHSGGTTASDSGSGTVSTSSAENNMILVRLNATTPMQAGSNTYYFDARLTGATRNLDSMKLIVTYEYSQTSATQLKTVYFYGNQQTGASSTTNLDAVVNPNLTEGGISVKDSFAVFKGQVNGSDNTISGSFAASGSCGAASGVAVADGALESVYGYIVLFDMTNSINLTTNNCIRHTVNVATFARSVEWIITFEYSYYSTAEADDLIHTKTVRYMMGTLAPIVGGSQSTIGTQQINLPENKPSNPFTSAYINHYIHSMDAGATITTCISTDVNCSGTTSPQASIDYGNTREQSGGVYALDDVAGFFNTNFTSNPQTFTANVNDSGGDSSGISAEAIITYRFNADTSSTVVKTVWFWAGQETLSRTNTAFTQSSESGQTNWNTSWPESGTKTFRNGAVYAAFNYNGTTGVSTAVSAVIMIDDTSVDGADSTSGSVSGTGENLTSEMMAKISTQVPATFGAQADINFSLSTDSTTLPLFRSPISYFTVETATSLAPEFAVILVPFAVAIPIVGRFCLERRKKLALAERRER